MMLGVSSPLCGSRVEYALDAFFSKVSVKTKCKLFIFCVCFLLTYNIICHIIYKNIYYTAYNIANL